MTDRANRSARSPSNELSQIIGTLFYIAVICFVIAAFVRDVDLCIALTFDIGIFVGRTFS